MLSQEISPLGISFSLEWLRPALSLSSPWIWLNVGSHVLLAGGFYSFLFTLVYFIQKRRDLSSPAIYVAMAVFCYLMGTLQILDLFYEYGMPSAEILTIKILTAL